MVNLLRAKKYLGQNFLFDPSILKKIVNAANINPNDTIIEIGAGYGSLTLLLAEVCKKVIAIEFDEELFDVLRQNVGHQSNIEVVNYDALKYPYEKHEHFKVVANIPYYITTPILFRLIKARKNLESITLTLQKEVAERLVAKPGSKDYGVLSLSIQYFADTQIKFIIPAGAFRPIPKVNSAVVHIQILESPRVAVPDEKLFFRLIKAGFSQRRKTIMNALKTIDPNIKEILISSGIDIKSRAEILSIDDFRRLCEAVYLKKISSQ